jgi:segregation and condensation protein B
MTNPDNENRVRSYAELLPDQPWTVDADDALVPPGDATDTEVPPPPARILEALLFVGGPPLTASRACEAIRGLSTEQFHAAIAELNRRYRDQARPYHIVAHDHGHTLELRPSYRMVVERLYGTAREARLSAAAVDVLALVAYRQPIGRQEIESLRGIDSSAILRQLVRRGLIAVVQRGEAQQREVAYGTTDRFLEIFDLSGLDDLPQTQDLQTL